MPRGALSLQRTALPFRKAWHKPGLLLLNFFVSGLFFIYQTDFYFEKLYI